MCVYCMVAEQFTKQWPIWPQPSTINPRPWTLDELKQFQDLLQRVKALEDKLGGCECPNDKDIDYIKVIGDKIAELEKHAS